MRIIYSGPILTLPEIFTDILPDGYNVYIYISDDNQYGIYINNTEVELTNLTSAVGYITFHIDFDEKEINLQFIYSTIKKSGIGHYLMILIAYIGNTFNIKTILLEDDSKLARTPNSIYVKLGCEYTDVDPYPEMECSLKTVLSKWDIFKDKYLNQGFFIE